MLSDISPVLRPHQGKFVVDEANVERCVVNDQLRALDELEEFIGDFGKPRLADQKFVGDTVNTDRAFVTFAIRLQVNVKMPTGQAATDQLDTTDLDDAVTIRHRHTGGFRYRGRWICYPCFAMPLTVASCTGRDSSTQRPLQARARLAVPDAAHFVDATVGELVGTLVARVADMPTHPLPFHRMATDLFIRSCHRSAFLTGSLAAVFQPRFFQLTIHSVMPFITY